MGRKIRKLVLSNLGLKAAAFILAVLLWYVIQGEQKIETFVRVDVQLVNHPERTLVTNEVTDEIVLAVRGTQSKISWLQNHGLKPYVIDLANTAVGSVLFRLFSYDFKLPQGVEVTRINPQLIEVVLEREVSKVVAVKPQVQGELESGFEVAEVKASPAIVTIVGARSKVRSIKEVMTEPITLNGVRENKTETALLQIEREPHVWLKDQQEIEVRLQIKENVVSETFKGLPITVRGRYKNRLKRKTLRAVIKGPAGAMYRLKENPPTVHVVLPKNITFPEKKARLLRLTPRLQVGKEPVQVVKTVPRRVLVEVQP